MPVRGRRPSPRSGRRSGRGAEGRHDLGRAGVDPGREPHPLRLAVLGDSIAHGTGARRVEDTLGRLVAAALTAEGFDVDLHVVAVPGAVSAQLAAQVRRVQPLAPDLALVVIGANDLARFVPPAVAAEHLGAVVAGLRAGGTDVVVVPAPDMSSVPFVPPAFRAPVQIACSRLQQAQTRAVEAAGGQVAAIGAAA